MSRNTDEALAFDTNNYNVKTMRRLQLDGEAFAQAYNDAMRMEPTDLMQAQQDALAAYVLS